MTPDELIEKCNKAINSPILGGKDAKVQLIVKGRWGKSSQKRLCPSGPSGQILADGPDGYVRVLFKAQEVLDFAKKALEKSR